MSDDLNLLISFLSYDLSLVKVAICIPHGMSDPKWENIEYFREPEMDDVIREAMHPHVESFCAVILTVEGIFDIKGK